MKILKITLILSTVLLFSCSQDDTLEQAVETANLNTTISNFDYTNIGMYKGTFTTFDATARGVVEVAILDKVPSRATVTLASGITINLTSTAIVTKGQNVAGLHFTSESDSQLEFNFDFMVDDDGSNPEITNVSLSTNEGAILIVKETSRGPVLAQSGTFVCTECNGHPNFPAGDNTYNIVFVSSGDGAEVRTQVTVYGAVYYSTTNTQSNCSALAGTMNCDISGSTVFGSKSIDWTGQHNYSNRFGSICTDISGTWSFTSANYGTLTGTFQDDVSGECF